MPEQFPAMPATSGPSLICRPGRSGNTLAFPYTIENPGPVDLFVMDALPIIDPESRRAGANEHAPVVICSADGEVKLGKFTAPLPTDRRVALPITHLARHLAAGATLEGRLEIPLPLAEASPYFADLTLRQYEIMDVRRVMFTIGYWPAGHDDLVATPADFAPDRFVVVTRNTVKSARQALQTFPTNGLQVFRRTDAFPRPFG